MSGCRNHCDGCFQPETWDFEYGKPFTKDVEEYILKCLNKDYIRGLTVLGGEPFEPENQRTLVKFLREVKKRYPNKDIWCYTGYTLEKLVTDGNHCRCEITDEMLTMIDVLVDGRFEEELKDLSCKWCGSTNQRVIDLNKTITNQDVVLYK